MSNDKIHLDPVKFNIRLHSLYAFSGPGSLINASRTYFLVGLPDNNYCKSHFGRDNDIRLKKAIQLAMSEKLQGTTSNFEIDDLYVPDKGIDIEDYPVSLFPTWLYCPNCKEFKPVKEWLDDYHKLPNAETDDDFLKNLMCPHCANSHLIPIKFVLACANGHVEDLDWSRAIHHGHVCMKSKNPRLSFDPKEQKFTCKDCGESTTMSQLSSEEASHEGYFKDLHCSGKSLWQSYRSERNCNSKEVELVPINSSYLYYPESISILKLPPFLGVLEQKIKDSDEYTNFLASRVHHPDDPISFLVDDLSSNTDFSNYSKPEIQAACDHLFEPAQQTSTSLEEIRYLEYCYLTGEKTVSTEEEKSHLNIELQNAKEYGVPGLSHLSLIHTMEELTAILGFSRLYSLSDNFFSDSFQGLQIHTSKDDSGKTNHYSFLAAKNKSEGIFLSFDKAQIETYLRDHPSPEFDKAADIANKVSTQKIKSSRVIDLCYYFIHTLSHVLIKQFAGLSGYQITDCHERIYYSNNEKTPMFGLLIYVTTSDQIGTLGGLVRLGRKDMLPKLLLKGLEEAMFCANDPICSLSEGQGFGKLNYSACGQCALIPDICCETGNRYLDRTLLVGNDSERSQGFFYNYVITEDQK
jgi:hypothetical protein